MSDEVDYQSSICSSGSTGKAAASAPRQVMEDTEREEDHGNLASISTVQVI